MSCVQSTLATARHASQYPIRGLGQDKRLGVFIGNVQASVDGRFRFSAAIPTPSFQVNHCLVYRQNGPGLRFRHAGVRGLIDTRIASHRSHYVNRAEHQPQAEHVGHQDPLRRRSTLFTPHSTQIGAAGSAWRCCWTAAAACQPSAATAAWPAGRFAEARRLWRQHRDHAPRHQRHR